MPARNNFNKQSPSKQNKPLVFARTRQTRQNTNSELAEMHRILAEIIEHQNAIEATNARTNEAIAQLLPSLVSIANSMERIADAADRSDGISLDSF